MMRSGRQVLGEGNPMKTVIVGGVAAGASTGARLRRLDESAEIVVQLTPGVEKAMTDSGILLLKYWLEVGPDEQTRRLETASTTRGRSGSSRTWT
jgi:NADPH-dependent 2,4-dienoyl-CoA reductase/sulfur reductase-like enzyme